MDGTATNTATNTAMASGLAANGQDTSGAGGTGGSGNDAADALARLFPDNPGNTPANQDPNPANPGNPASPDPAPANPEGGLLNQSLPGQNPANGEAGKDASPANPDNRAGQDKQADPDNLPVTDPSLVDLGLPELDRDIAAQFGEQAKALKLTPAQMRGLAQWQADLEASRREAQISAGTAALAKEWGRGAQANQRQTLALVTALDRALAPYGENVFSQALAKSGAANDVNIIRGLHLLASRGAEDALAARHAPASATRPEEPIDVLSQMFKS